MNAASSIEGAVDGIPPVVLVDQAVQGVLVAGDRVFLMQGQARPCDGFNGLHNGRWGALLSDGIRIINLSARFGRSEAPNQPSDGASLDNLSTPMLRYRRRHTAF